MKHSFCGMNGCGRFATHTLRGVEVCELCKQRLSGKLRLMQAVMNGTARFEQEPNAVRVEMDDPATGERVLLAKIPK